MYPYIMVVFKIKNKQYNFSKMKLSEKCYQFDPDYLYILVQKLLTVNLRWLIDIQNYFN